MKQIVMNEAALTVAMDFMVGELGRGLVVDLYDKINGLSQHAYQQGFNTGVEVGEVNKQYAASDAYALGYLDARSVFTGGEQPVIVMPPYEGDRVDETELEAFEREVDEAPDVASEMGVGLPAMQEQPRSKEHGISRHDDIWR